MASLGVYLGIRRVAWVCVWERTSWSQVEQKKAGCSGLETDSEPVSSYSMMFRFDRTSFLNMVLHPNA